MDRGRQRGQGLFEPARGGQRCEIGIERPLERGDVARGVDHAAEQLGLPVEGSLVTTQALQGHRERLRSRGPAIVAAGRRLFMGRRQRPCPGAQAAVERGRERPREGLAALIDKLPDAVGGGPLQGLPGQLLRLEQPGRAAADRLAEPGDGQRRALLLAIGLYFVAILLSVLKWHVVARAQELNASFTQLAIYYLVGLFFGNLLPSHVGGDVVRAYGLARASNRTEAAATSVLVDRLMGLFAFFGAAMVMVVLAAFTLTRGAELEQIEIAIVLVAAIFLFGTALLFSRRFAQRMKWVFDLGILRPFRPMAIRFYEALQVYRHSYRALALNLAISGSIVIVTTFVWYAVALALGDDTSIFYFFIFNPLIAFVLLIPISFNGLGPKEATAVFFFGLVGMPGEIAISMSLIFHLIVVLTSLPGGLLWWHERSLAPPTETKNQVS